MNNNEVGLLAITGRNELEELVLCWRYISNMSQKIHITHNNFISNEYLHLLHGASQRERQHFLLTIGKLCLNFQGGHVWLEDMKIIEVDSETNNCPTRNVNKKSGQ